MVKACAGGAHDFETYAKIMTEHHGLIHLRGNKLIDSTPLRTSGFDRDTRRWQPKGSGKFGSRSSGSSTTAYVSDVIDSAYVSQEHRADDHYADEWYQDEAPELQGQLGMPLETQCLPAGIVSSLLASAAGLVLRRFFTATLRMSCGDDR